MSWDNPGKKFSLPAAGDLSATQYTALTVPDTNGRVTTAGAGVNIVGIQQNKPGAIDRPVEIMSDGISKMVATATVTIGDKIAVGANGKAVTATSTAHVIGTALEGTTVNNTIIAVLLHPNPILA